MTTKVSYADQSARDLQFYLLAKSVDVEALTVLRQAEMDWRSHKVRLGVLGASHFMTLTTKSGEVLNEIFACAKLDVSPSVRSGPLGSLRTSVVTNVGGLNYSFTPRLVSWRQGAFELDQIKRRVEGELSSHEVGLSFAFPAAEGDVRIPHTLILAVFKRIEFSVWTAHSYPSEEEIVFTKTTIKEVC